MNPSSVLKKRSKSVMFSHALFLFFLSCSSIVFFSNSCRLYKLERKLDPVNAEFLSKVRYIITKEERRIFLELPASEREKFKEEFWKRRDSDPETEENEFKMEYFDRVEKADELFSNEGKPGYVADRGRIYILFGPPSYRETHYTKCNDPYSLLYKRCGEIWHYGGFPVVFVDSACIGKYQLVTYNLTSLREINLMYMQELSRAQARAQDTFFREKGFFDFDLNVKKTLVEPEKVGGIISIEIPYAAIWFRAEDDRLETTLDLHLEIKDFENKLIWEYEEAFEIVMSEAEIKEKQRDKYKIEVPYDLKEDLAMFRQRKIKLHATLKNRTGGEESKKVVEFTP